MLPPLAGAYDITPPPVFPPGEDIPYVLPPPAPAQRAPWLQALLSIVWAVVWCIGFFIVTNGAMLVGLIVAILVELLLTPDRKQFLNDLLASQKTGGMSPATAKAVGAGLFCQELATILLSCLAMRLVIGRGWRRAVGLRRPTLLHVVLVILALGPLLVLPEKILELAKLFLPSIDYQHEVEAMMKGWHWMFGVLVVGLGAGIGEELWFRGFIGRQLLAGLGFWGGILVTSLFFGVFHVDPPYAVATAAMGIVLHLVYVWTRSLWLPILLHVTNNSLSVVAVTFLAEEGKDPSQSPWWLHLAALLLLLAVCWALYRSRAQILPGPFVRPAAESIIPGVDLVPAEPEGRVVTSWPGWTPSLLVLATFAVFVAAMVVSELK